MLKGTCKSSHLRSQWVGRNQCSIHSWKNPYYIRFGLEIEKLETFVNFYNFLETPAEVVNREENLGAIMTWERGLTLSWQQNNVHNGLL